MRDSQSTFPGRDAVPTVLADRQVGPTRFVEMGHSIANLFAIGLTEFLLFLIQLYRWILSPAQVFLFGGGSGCRFTPTCSQYAAEAIREHGALYGGVLAIKRICHCHPLGGCGHDPVPMAAPLAKTRKEGLLISNG